MAGWLDDLRFAARTMARQRAVSALAALALALGIGAATAVFSVADGILLRPLPYPSPERLLRVFQVGTSGGRGSFSHANFADLQAQSRSLVAAAEFSTWSESVVAGEEAVRVQVGVVSRDFFAVFGTSPRLGRAFLDEDRHPGASPAAVVSARFWRSRLGGSEDLSRTTLRGAGSVYSVVGVMPDSFAFPSDVDVWIPRELYPPEPSRTAHNWQVVARLADGVGLDQARSEVSGVARRLKAQYGADTWMENAALVPLREALTGHVRPALLVLAGAVGFLLLVACANVANLLLAQAEARRRELGVKTALGASPSRLTRQLLAESLLLALTGGVLGVTLAAWGVRGLLSLGGSRLPRAQEIGIDAGVLAFALALCVLTAVGLGSFTAWRVRGGAEAAALREGGRAPSAAGRRLVLDALVASQMAATVVLLAGVGLLGRSLLKLLSTDPGFRIEHTLAMDVSLPFAEQPDAPVRLAGFHAAVVERLRALPGVEEAGGVSALPLTGPGANGRFLVVDRPPEKVEEFEALMKDPALTGEAQFRIASAGYFRAMGIPLVRGRLFDDADGADAPHAALISESLARRRWPGEDPLGRHVEFGNMDGDMRLFTIVGVVGDVREGLDAAPEPTFYGCFAQRPRATAAFTYVMRSTGDPAALARAARAAATSLAPEVAPRTRTLQAIRNESVADRSFTLDLLGTFGTAALILAGLGLYGVSAYSVALRTREMGVRMALGARPGQVLGLVIAEGTRPVVIGAGAGLLLAGALSRLLRALLYGVEPWDPVSFGGAALILTVFAILACLVPANRAARVDPVVSLRCE